MTDPDFNLQSSYSNVLTVYDAAMPCGKSFSKGCTQKNATAFGQKVEQTPPINNTPIPDEDRLHNRFDDSRIKQMSITLLDSKEICLDESSELSVRPETFQKADSGTASEIKIVRVWSMAGEDGSHSVDKSHQYPNVMEQISPIIQADNLGSKSVSNPSKKITDNKASRLERRRKYQRERRKDPAFAERERQYHREYKRKRYKDPAFAERYREYQREYQRERRKDPAFAERQRELRKDPAFAERHREYQRKRRKDPAFAEYQREYQRDRRKDPVFAEGHRIYMNTYNRIKKQTANKGEASKQAKIAREQYLQSIHSAGNSGELTLTSNSVETNQSSSKNSDGSPPSTFSLQADGVFTVSIEPVST